MGMSLCKLCSTGSRLAPADECMNMIMQCIIMFIHALELAAVLTWLINNFNDIYGGGGQFLISERGIFWVPSSKSWQL